MDSLLAEISRFGPSNAFSDVTLVATDGEREAHAALLAARSEVLAAMLASPLAEGQRGVDGCWRVALEFPGAVVDGLLRWVYADILEASLPLEALLQLQVAADFLNIRGLLARCSERLAEKMTTRALPGAVELACAQNAQALQRALAVYAAKHWDSAPEVRDAAAPLHPGVLEERQAIVSRKLKSLKSTGFSAGSGGRAPTVFWRQWLPVEQQKGLLAQAVEAEDGALRAALWRALRESTVGCSLLDAAWAAEAHREPFEREALEDKAAQEAQQERLRAQRQGLQEELKRLQAEAEASAAAVRPEAADYRASSESAAVECRGPS